MKRGLTLVELVIAIALAAALAIPVGWMISSHLGAVLQARDTSVATSLARYEVERLESLNNFFANPDLNVPGQTIPNFQGTVYTMARVVECLIGNCTSTAEGSQAIKRITIRVTRPPSTAPLVTLITYRTKHVTFGS